MPTIDMRKAAEPALGEEEEVKEPTSDEDEGTGEETGGESSPPEENQDKETETETVEETESDAEAEGATVSEGKTETVEVEALRKERERILNEIKELRTERRDLRSKPIEPVLVDKPKEDELKDVNPEDVALVEKVLRAKGYVQREELHQQRYKETLDSVQNAWLDKHPEYKPENDPEDANWKALQGTIHSFFKAPANPKDVEKVLDAAHAMVSGGKTLPVRSGTETEDAKRKIQVSSKGGSGGGSKSPSEKKSLLPSREHLKGFSDEDMKELFS